MEFKKIVTWVALAAIVLSSLATFVTSISGSDTGSTQTVSKK